MSATQTLTDDLNKRLMYLLRYENNLDTVSLATLKRLERDLVALISARLSTIDSGERQLVLDSLLSQVKERIRSRYAEINQFLSDQLIEESNSEAIWLQTKMEDATGLPEEWILLYALPRDMALTIQGAPLDEWLGRQAQAMANRIADQIRIGLNNGENTDQIITRIRGTKTLNFKDGLFAISERELSAVAKTGVQHVASLVRTKMFEANGRIIKAIRWSSILDSRTTPICIARDEKMYTIAGKPIGHDLPWLGGPGNAHWNCRSVGIPIFKSYTDIDIPDGELTRKIKREMDGSVPEGKTYEEWLNSQSSSFQDEVLGAKKADLWRQGKLSIKDLVTSAGRAVPLSALQ